MLRVLSVVIVLFAGASTLTVNITKIAVSPSNRSTADVHSKSLVESRTAPSVYKWNAEEFPRPDVDFKKCGISYNETVENRFRALLCDPDRILQPNEIDKLSTILREIDAVRKCYCEECAHDGRTSIPVGVALARNIFKKYPDTDLQSAQYFANRLREVWPIGFCDNSILILVVVNNDNLMLTTSVGEIAGGVLDPAIFTNSTTVTEHFRNKNIFQGLSFILLGMRNFLANVQKAPQNNSKIGPRIGVSNNEKAPEGSPAHETAIFVLGAVTAFLLLLTILIGLLVHTKTKFERVAVATDPQNNPAQGYFSNNQTLPKTPPAPEDGPSPAGNETPNGRRRVDTVNGPVDYEPVSIEDHEVPEEPTVAPQTLGDRKFSRKDSEEHSNLHGKDELLEQTDQISIASNKDTAESRL